MFDSQMISVEGGELRFHHLEIMRDLGRLAEHDAGRAVFLGGQVHGLFDPLGIEPFAGDGEVDVDLREHLGVAVGARGVEVGDAIRHLLAALPQDVHQQHFHRAQRRCIVKSLGLRFYRVFATLPV
jgi:hypothetical protein